MLTRSPFSARWLAVVVVALYPTIRKLLDEKPAIAGITLPGMPSGRRE